MGNKICGRRRPVEERLTRPQRILRQPSDVDYKKLRKLILSEKLAPCFDAADSPDLSFSAGADDLEECPICFLYYPSLNRSRCCAKGICTECFLQMKPSRTTQSAQCPFCKTSCYAVEYHGARTEEEKVLEWAEEQKVIEAKLRIQYESQIEEQVIGPQSLVELLPSLSNAERPSTGDNAQQECSIVQESLEVDGSSDLSTCRTWHEEAVDLEEIMLMEAIWQSLQDSRLQQGESSSIGGRSHGENSPGASTLSDYRGEPFSYCSLAEGVAIAIAKLAKLNIMRPHISELDCETIQTQRNLNETIICDPNSTQQETGCSSSSSLRTVDLPSRLAAELNAS